MKLNELLKIKYPIIQGGMANIATGEFAASVSNAGGLGLIGAGGMNAKMLKEEIQKCKKLTDYPFGVNIMLLNPEAKEMAQIVIDEQVPIVTTGAGNPGIYMKMWKEAGIKVFPVVPSVALAKRLERAGVDGLIVEGCEAGGHIGEATTMALVPQLASQECPIHENYKQAVLKAKDTSTTVTGRINGTPVRILKNKMAKTYIQKEKEGATMMELEKYTLGSLKKAVFEGNVDEGSLMAGQVAGMVHEIKPVQQILQEMMDELKVAYQNLEI